MTKNTAIYSNNSRTTLSGSISSTSTILPVVNAAGFPVLSSPTDFFLLTLEGGSGIEIVKVRGVVGNTFTECIRGWEGTVARDFPATTPAEVRLTAGTISQFARLQDRLAPVVNLSDVTSPATMDGNSFVTQELDPTLTPVIGVVSDNKWRLLNYPDRVMTGTLAGGSTASSLIVAGVSTLNEMLTDFIEKMYVVQITSGLNAGVCRFIQGVTSTNINVSLFFNTPTPGDSFEIYRCISGWKAPKGNFSDRMFFENDTKIWNNYTIPTGRNASSTGPVTIMNSAVVTVSEGSAWSIV